MMMVMMMIMIVIMMIMIMMMVQSKKKITLKINKIKDAITRSKNVNFKSRHRTPYAFSSKNV